MGQVAPVEVPVVPDIGAVVTKIIPIMTDVHSIVLSIATIVKTTLGLSTNGEEKAGGEKES